MPSDVRHPGPRRRSDIPPRSLQAADSGLTGGDSDAPSSGGNHSGDDFFKRLLDKVAWSFNLYRVLQLVYLQDSRGVSDPWATSFAFNIRFFRRERSRNSYFILPQGRI